MNIETLRDYIVDFKDEVIESGFKRDLDDYSSSIPSSRNNILALREIAEKVLAKLDQLYSGDLPDELKSLFAGKSPRPFTESPHNSNLRKLVENTEVQQQEFFNRLNELINQLRSEIQQNLDKIVEIDKFVEPYATQDTRRIAKDNLATIAVVFSERQTITSLTQLTKTLAAWNRVIPIYHQLLKSESPQDIQIVEIQNGSIEFVCNLNADVALDLVELFKVGFQVFAAYLGYKKMIKPIIDSFHGNKKLISLEDEREKLLLENIGTAIQTQIEEQHKKAKKADKGVDGTAITKKVEQVTNLVASHIVRGNDLKLLALPATENAQQNEDDVAEKRDSLREQSLAARRELRLIPSEAQQKLLEAYGKLKESE